MAITFPALRANSDKQPNIDQRPSVTLIPAVTGDSAWELNDMTIEADGDIGGNAVAQGAYARRYVPGLVQGHLYRITIGYVNTLMDITISMGGKLVYTVSGGSSGTAVQYIQPDDGDKLTIEHLGVGNYTGAIQSIIVEAVDPLNVDLIPDA